MDDTSLHVKTGTWQRGGGSPHMSLGADLLENRSCFRCRISCFGDGTADDDVTGSGGNGFGGGGDAGLIAVAGAGRADAGCDDGEIMAQFGAHGGGLAGGGNDALTSVV